MFSLVNFNPNQQEENKRTRVSVRALAVLYPGAAKGIAPPVAACVAGRVGGLCERVWWEGGNPQVPESAGFNRSHNFLNRSRCSFPPAPILYV